MKTNQKVILSDVYKKIKAQRVALKITPEVMAQKLCITVRTYLRIETGLTALSLERFIHIAEILKCNPSDLLKARKISMFAIAS